MRLLCAALTSIVLAGVTPGCLSQSHVVPRHDLQALADQDPQVRGQRVRVIQGMHGEAEPPPAAHADGSGHVSVVVVAPGPRVGAVPAPRGRTSARTASDRGKLWVVAAAAVAVGLAVTEGARYDGWVYLDPMHPVHLYGWDGSYQWLPLAHITPETAAATRKAIVRETEGPWHRLGRAPLNRVGWTYSMLVGSAETPVGPDATLRGFTTHIQLGRFPAQEIGLLLDFSLGWAGNEYGELIYESRSAIELQLLPLAAGVLHAGGFGQLGVGYRLDDTLYGHDRRGYFAGGGGLLQLEITTRLALTLRAGVTYLHSKPTTDLTLGVSIY